jgi:hypothetical protein
MLGAVRLGRLTTNVRSLLRAGYGLDHVRRVIAAEEQAPVEERAAPRPARWTRVTTAWLATGVAAAAGGMALAHADSTAVSLLGLGTAIIAPTIAIRRVVGDWLGGRSLLRRLMQGRVGRWTFGAASVGLDDRPLPRPVGAEPTVVAIARAADELYLALPDGRRRALGDVRAVIDRLAAEALALQGSGGATAERKASAVAALESLRLDLLRLSAGSASSGELTRDLDAAARIGDRIDARLAERDEPSPAPNG